MSKRRHKFQVIWWPLINLPIVSQEFDGWFLGWDWGIRRWNRIYRSVGLHRNIHIGPIEIRCWAMKPDQWSRMREAWRF